MNESQTVPTDETTAALEEANELVSYLRRRVTALNVALRRTAVELAEARQELDEGKPETVEGE